MSRLSFRPRPLDVHKKLVIVRSLKDLQDDETPTSSSYARLLRFASDTDKEVHQVSKKLVSEIPTPQCVDVDTYERDYSRTFSQPTSYLRGRGARAEIGEFVEYDLDNEDEDWVQEFNRGRKILMPEMFENLLFKLEVLDHKARERAGVITPTLSSPIPILLQLEAATEALQTQTIKYATVQSVFNYWKEKVKAEMLLQSASSTRERWQKPVLRRLQPPPPANDTNPYNVFRPREKAHRLHTRRMQRRENNVLSFEKLQQVRRNLDQAKTLLEALIKREEKKRDVMESEVSVQRIQLKYKDETELLEDSLVLPGFLPLSCKLGSSEEDEYLDSDDSTIRPVRTRPGMQTLPFTESDLGPTESIKKESIQTPHGWFHKKDPHEPVMLFTRPLIPEKLAAAGIVPPSDTSARYGGSTAGRMGRGGRIIFDRWNPVLHSPPILTGNSFYASP